MSFKTYNIFKRIFSTSYYNWPLMEPAYYFILVKILPSACCTCNTTLSIDHIFPLCPNYKSIYIELDFPASSLSPSPRLFFHCRINSLLPLTLCPQDINLFTQCVFLALYTTVHSTLRKKMGEKMYFYYEKKNLKN